MPNIKWGKKTVAFPKIGKIDKFKLWYGVKNKHMR